MLHPKQTQHLFLTIQAEKLCTACTVNIKEESSLLSNTVVGTVDRYTARTTEGHCKKKQPVFTHVAFAHFVQICDKLKNMFVHIECFHLNILFCDRFVYVTFKLN